MKINQFYHADESVDSLLFTSDGRCRPNLMHSIRCLNLACAVYLHRQCSHCSSRL